MRTANREKPLPHKLCSSRQVYVHALLVQHLYRPSVFFQHMVWYGPTSETAWMHRRQKNWLKYTDCTELKIVSSRIYSNCSIYSSLFSSPSNLLLFVLFDQRKILWLAVQVCCLFYFLLHSTFFNGKVKSVFLVAFICFFKWAFINKRVFFLGWVQLHQNWR